MACYCPSHRFRIISESARYICVIRVAAVYLCLWITAMYEKTAKWMDTAVSSALLCDFKKKIQSTNTERHVHLFVMNVMQRLK